MRTLGQRFKQARKLRGFSQTQLAKAIGLRQSSISEIESGETRMIEGSTLVDACAILNVRPEWIIYGRGAMTSDPLPPSAATFAHCLAK
jgi:transcriptional regulator with XRE-family HTH domain